MTAQKEIQNFLDKMTQKCAPMEKKLCELHWNLAITGDFNIAKEAAKIEKEFRMVFSNPQELAQLKTWQKQKIEDPLLRRQVDLLIFGYLSNQLDEETISDLVERQTEIENIFNNFRAELGGKKATNNDIKDILKNETNSKTRQTAWEASKQIAIQVADKVIALAKKRNEAAKKLGFENHFEMSMSLQEFDADWLFSLFGDLKKATQKTFEKKTKKLHKKMASHYGVKEKEIMPWHYEDPFAQESPSFGTIDIDPYLKNQDVSKICDVFFKGIDLDVQDVLKRSDLFEREGKSQHAFCITMDKKRDVRVLANIRPNSYWASTMLHELGHAAYAKNIDLDLPYFLRDEAHIFATEAIAMMMERMIHHPHWLQEMLKIPAAEIKKSESDLWEALSLSKLIIARWILVVTNFERAFYADPDQDLNSLWWNLVEEYQLIQKPKNRNHQDWAAKIHIATFPCYYQNYLLGELLAAQIVQTLEKEAIKKSSREASFIGVAQIGKLLKERQFKLGKKLRWDDLVLHVTGKKLGFESFVGQFC